MRLVAAATCAAVLAIARFAAADGPAPRRPVAVVDADLSGDPAAIELIKAIDSALGTHPALARVADPDDESALRDPFVPDEDAPLVAQASAQRTAAQAALRQYHLAAAAQAAGEGLIFAAQISPSGVVAVYADLVFELGVAELGTGDAAGARASFVLARRLVPDLALDESLLPEVIAAYEHAQPPSGRGAIDVSGHGQVWIDGHELGKAPGAFEVDAGPHFVQLAGDDRRPAGMRVDVAAGAHATAAVAYAPLDRAHRIARARVALSRSPDTVARTTPIRQLAEILGVHDVIVVAAVANANGGTALRTQAWHDEPAAWTMAFAGDQVGALLDAIAPPPRPAPLAQTFAPPSPVLPPLPIAIAVPWYRRHWVWWTSGAVTAAAVVAGVVLAREQGTIGIAPGLGFAPPRSP